LGDYVRTLEKSSDEKVNSKKGKVERILSRNQPVEITKRTGKEKRVDSRKSTWKKNRLEQQHGKTGLLEKGRGGDRDQPQRKSRDRDFLGCCQKRRK